MVVILVSVKEHDEQTCVNAAHPVAMPGFPIHIPFFVVFVKSPRSSSSYKFS
jgi:hypothetical protein